MDVIDDIESSLSAGVTRSFIVDELVADGLEINLASFETMLRRIRKKRGKPTVKPSRSEPNKAKASTVQESNKNDEPEPENDYDELAVLSARERRERRIAQFTSETPTNRIADMILKDKK